MFREEHGLMVFENRMLSRIFGPKTDDRRLETGVYEELCNLYSLPIIRIKNQGG
jgi:hypothetical protein